VRYVIDTGLERVKRWNKEKMLEEMVTTQISSSSMAQRAGRAGRVSSGICVRLYSKDVEETISKAIRSPRIENSNLLSVVLKMKNMTDVPELPSPISKENFKGAEDELHKIGLLDDSMKITKEGNLLPW